MTTPWLVELLDKYSSKNYHIEYDGFLSNHMIHGIIALYRLAADEKRIQEFIKFYTHKLRDPEVVKEELTIEDLKGARISYPKLVEYYRGVYRDCNNDMKTVLEKVWPQLCDGSAGSAIHGLIHLGYALSVEHDPSAIDGLAYVHHSYIPITCEKLNKNPAIFGQGKENPFIVVNDMTEKLTDKMLNKVEDETIQKMANSYLQRRIAALFKFYPEEVLEFVGRIQVPKDVKTCLDLAYYALHLSLIVYVKSARKNDFFLLHGITSGWSVVQIVKILGDCDLSRRTITVYMAILLSAYVGQLSPKLNSTDEVKDEVNDEWWKKITEELLARELDEHIYKLIQVCKELWKDKGWPECPIAARIALDHSLKFRD
ncbi:unnamed protein product [Dimorphilus gyrociliatus]|uniref:Uncharacterized protein n=1 Tax=Dimorphilus gyrociliatus TaxID=2664684 RepID=A0A7I8W2T1_9ANNE|nr:unnamed protein product [Dimorphilus gyrociliatus]